MKKYLLLIAAVAAFNFMGCTTIPPNNWVGNLDCNLSISDLHSKVTEVLLEEGFNITSQTERSITAVSQTDDASSAKTWQNADITIRWQIQIAENPAGISSAYSNANNNRIVAVAFRDVSVPNPQGGSPIRATSTYGDNADATHNKYWRVRRKLERLCGNEMIIINTFDKKNQVDDGFGK